MIVIPVENSVGNPICYKLPWPPYIASCITIVLCLLIPRVLWYEVAEIIGRNRQVPYVPDVQSQCDCWCIC
jgi:hypothetical protein